MCHGQIWVTADVIALHPGHSRYSSGDAVVSQSWANLKICRAKWRLQWRTSLSAYVCVRTVALDKKFVESRESDVSECASREKGEKSLLEADLCAKKKSWKCDFFLDFVSVRSEERFGASWPMARRQWPAGADGVSQNYPRAPRVWDGWRMVQMRIAQGRKVHWHHFRFISGLHPKETYTHVRRKTYHRTSPIRFFLFFFGLLVGSSV